jgi:hypothetical protein
MTIVGAHVPLPNRPRSLPRFLSLWLASYLAPWGAAILARLTGIAHGPASVEYAETLVWFGVIPIGLAFGQWILMRRYIRNALRWAGATFVGALLAQSSRIIVGSTLGWEIPPDLPTMLVWALCYGAAWSVPQGLVLPGPRSAKMVWFIALMLTGILSVLLRTNLSHVLAQGLFFAYEETGYWIGPAAGYVPPISRWLILSLVSGSTMYWSLRRDSVAGISRVYARFD